MNKLKIYNLIQIVEAKMQFILRKTNIAVTMNNKFNKIG